MANNKEGTPTNNRNQPNRDQEGQNVALENIATRGFIAGAILPIAPMVSARMVSDELGRNDKGKTMPHAKDENEVRNSAIEGVIAGAKFFWTSIFISPLDAAIRGNVAGTHPSGLPKNAKQEPNPAKGK